MSFFNVYDDPQRADAYGSLDFPGTYYLAFRDLPELLRAHVKGSRALDFGCGTGRSSRFLEQNGFKVTGIDIAATMIERARKADPKGTYRLVTPGDFSAFAPGSFDLVLSAFPFDNIPGVETRLSLLSGLRELLAEDGRIVLLGSTPQIYCHEWASFSTRDFPENREAPSGTEVFIIMKDVDDKRPVVDVLWRHQDYLELFGACGLAVLVERRPLGLPEDPVEWLSETEVAPWVIYVLGKISG